MGVQISHSLTVTTAAATVAKTTTELVTFQDKKLYLIKFTLGNSAASPTVNGVNIVLGTTNASAVTFTVGANAVVPMVYDAGLNKLLLTGSYRTSDAIEDANMRWNQGNQVGSGVTREKLLMLATDGKFHPLSIGDNADANGKTISSQAFLINGDILYYSATVGAAADSVNSNMFSEINLGSAFARTSNQISGWTNSRPVYLKGTLNSSGNFVLAGSGTATTAFMTQALPTTEDGFLYKSLGYMYNTTTSFRLIAQHPIYEFRNGELREFTYGPFSEPVANASGVVNMMIMSETTYNALSPKNANTLYFLT
jgi:hypothetical protein